MDKKEIRFSILENSAEASSDRIDIQVSPSEKERIFEMSRKMYETKKKAAANHSEPADEVSGVMIERRPGWYRAVSAVAAFAIVAAGIGGSVFMVNSLKDNTFHPATEVTDSMETPPVDPAAEAAEELTYDLSTKEGIYLKMLNSIDFFDRLSGRLIYQIPYDTKCVVMDFSVDLDTAESYTMHTASYLRNLDEVLGGMHADYEIVHEENRANEFVFYSDGTDSYRIDGNVISSGNGNRPTQRNRTPLQAEDIAAVSDWFYSHDETDGRANEFYNRTSIYRDSELDCLVPDCEAQMVAAYYLTDFNAWEVTGEESFIGRDCLVIEGDVGMDFFSLEGVKAFTVYVDKETGYVLKYLGYDEAGTMSEYCVYQEIHFDADAAMITLDLDAYETLEYQEPVSQNYAYENSKGETYGNAGSIRMDQEHYDALPDLIVIGFDGGRYDGYIRKDEFLNIFIDGEEAFDMQPEKGNISETAIAVEVNVYDQEGEFIFTTTFYSEPENLKTIN